MRLLLTRPLADSQRMAETLAARGFDTLISPVIEIFPQHVMIPDKPYQAVLLTSANAVNALLASNLPDAIPIYCVGDATLARLDIGRYSNLQSAAGDVMNLIGLVRRELHAENGPILYLSAAVISRDIALDLGRDGFRVDRYVVYNAKPVSALDEKVASALRLGAIDGVLLSSTRSARLFLEMVSRSNLTSVTSRLTAFCISGTTAKAANQVDWAKVVVAKQPTQESLLETLPDS